jgi:hypothetical protein
MRVADEVKSLGWFHTPMLIRTWSHRIGDSTGKY